MINNSQQKGISLFLALIIMSTLSSLAIGVNAILIGQLKMLRGMENSLIAFYAADTGIEEVLYMDGLCRQGPPCAFFAWDCSDEIDCDDGIQADIITYNLGPASYSVEFDDGALNITSAGFYKKTKRALEAVR